MGATFERLENNKVKILFSVSPQEFEEALNVAYYKNKNKIHIPGFRRGKVTRQYLEARFGKDFFYNDAINIGLEPAYNSAIDELIDDFRVVSQPEINLISVSKEEGASLAAEVYIEPEACLSQYKGFTYFAPVTDITDQDIDNEINDIRDKNSRLITVTDRPSAMGDNLLIDFTGYINDEPIENADSKDFEIVLGSGDLVGTFEDQLTGHNAEDNFSVFVTFPEEYINEELQGKDARFDVTIKEIRQRVYPDIDDEFAQDVSEFDTLEELKDDIRSHLLEKAKAAAENEKQDQVLKALSTTFEIDIPECMIDTDADEKLTEMKMNFGGYRLSNEQLASYMGTTESNMLEDLHKRSAETVKLRIALLKIAELEGISVTRDDLIERINSHYENLPETEKQRLIEQKAFLKVIERELLIERALECLMSFSIEKEEEKKEEIL